MKVGDETQLRNITLVNPDNWLHSIQLKQEHFIIRVDNETGNIKIEHPELFTLVDRGSK